MPLGELYQLTGGWDGMVSEKFWVSLCVPLTTKTNVQKSSVTCGEAGEDGGRMEVFG